MSMRAPTSDSRNMPRASPGPRERKLRVSGDLLAVAAAQVLIVLILIGVSFPVSVSFQAESATSRPFTECESQHQGTSIVFISPYS